MKNFAAILLICLFPLSASADKSTIAKNALFANGKSLASKMGGVFQLAKNCGQAMANIDASSAKVLFQNNFDVVEMEIIMQQYRLQVEKEKGRSCDRGKIDFHLLMNHMATYMRLVGTSSKDKLQK